MSLYELTVPQYKKMLQNLERWLDKAVAFADQKKFDPKVLLEARLAPDQFPLTRQIQAACDQAKFCVARLTAKDPPSHPDTEQTVDELRARIHKVIAYLDGFRPGDFEGAETRRIELRLYGGKVISGQNYLVELQFPNFYFHVPTAYAILRHNGVDLGKSDFLGAVNFS